MLLRGLQKTTLLDYPGLVACTVFTGGCNFRCPFCHNASLLREGQAFDEEQFFAFLDKRKGILDGVCVSGGEPLLQPDMAAFLSKIKQRGFSVKLDTNGSFPDRLMALCGEGLVDYVAMDIKNSRAKYVSTAMCDAALLPKVEQSVAFLLKGNLPFEFRTTVAFGLHTPQDMREIGQWIKGAEKYYLQGFVDSGDVLGEGMKAASAEEMQALLEAVRLYVPGASLRGM